MIYLRKFDNHAAYEAAESSLVLPNVSLCEQENEVHYNPSTPPTPSHDYVEIGGIKWATMNIGATGVTGTGLYFQWADTQGYTASQVGSGAGQKYFGWDDYKYTYDGGETMSKYSEGDSKITLEPTDDAVKAAWGGNWRMPTNDEYVALGNAVTTAWTSSYQGSGVAGLVCTDKNNSSNVLFFPARGNASYGSVRYVGGTGYYWSSSLNADLGDNYAYILYFYDDYVHWGNDGVRSEGYPVRGVLADN